MFARSPFFESSPSDAPHSALTHGTGAAKGAVWTGAAFSTPAQGVWTTGFARLNGELPGGGWAAGGLIEILQDEAGGAVPVPPAHVCLDDPAGALAHRLIQRWTLAAGAAPDSGAPGSPGGLAAPGAEWRLLLPALVRLPGGVTLIGPPAA